VSQLLLSFKSHIEGKNANVEIYTDRIEWAQPRGVSAGKLTAGLATGGLSMLATGYKSGKAGTEMIPVKSITSVTTRRDGIRFTAVSVIASGNTVDFRVGHSEAGPIKEMLTSLVLGNHPAQLAPQHAAAQATEGPIPRQDPRTSITDELRKLAELRDAGVVTEAEFTAKKAELLARL
jgi:hypothetical protein